MVDPYDRKSFTQKSDEFDCRFDKGEEALVKDLDEIRNRIGIDRIAIIKIWLLERVEQEKASLST